MTGEGDNKMRTAPSIRLGNEEEQELRATATGADCAGAHIRWRNQRRSLIQTVVLHSARR